MDPPPSITNTAEEPELQHNRAAASPFGRDDADLIIHTADHVDFHVHRLILAMASSVFQDMFTLPQPPSTPDVAAESKPRVDVAEDSTTIAALLHIIYPFDDDTDTPSLDALRRVLDAARKYDVPKVARAMRRELVRPTFLEHEPLRVFAIACLFRMEEEAKIAAERAVVKDCVETASRNQCPELEEMYAGSYYRLLQLYRTRKVTTNAGVNTVKVDFKGIDTFCQKDNPPTTAPTHHDDPQQVQLDTEHDFTASSNSKHRAPDLVLKTRDGGSFHVHEMMIDFAMPGLLSRLECEPTNLPDAEDARGNSSTALHAYRVEEDTMTVKWLLQLCYPDQLPVAPDSLSPKQFLAVLEAALKYNSRRAEATLRSRWAQCMKPQPLLFYFFAATRGWKDEALLCARELVTAQSIATIQKLYIPQMENTLNHAYLSLLRYIDRCAKTADQIDVEGLPNVLCTDRHCIERYPSGVWSGAPPSWLEKAFLSSTRKALRQQPHSATVSSQAADKLLAEVATDKEDCSREAVYRTNKAGKTYQATPERVCSSSVSFRIGWANAFLAKYAAAVDSAVAAVKLDV